MAGLNGYTNTIFGLNAGAGAAVSCSISVNTGLVKSTRGWGELDIDSWGCWGINNWSEFQTSYSYGSLVSFHVGIVANGGLVSSDKTSTLVYADTVDEFMQTLVVASGEIPSDLGTINLSAGGLVFSGMGGMSV